MYVMIDELEQLMNMDWKMLVIGVLLIMVILPKMGETWKKFCEFIGYESKAARKEREFQEQIDELKRLRSKDHENYQEYHQQSICIRNELVESNKQVKEDISKLVKAFEEYRKEDNRRTVATLRNTLWRNHKEFTEQGYVTPEGLKTFEELGEVYEDAGGNDIFHDKLKPEVEALEIRY